MCQTSGSEGSVPLSSRWPPNLHEALLDASVVREVARQAPAQLHRHEQEQGRGQVHEPRHEQGQAQAPVPMPLTRSGAPRLQRASSSTVVYDASMLEACLRGDAAAVRALVDDLTPVIQSRAARALLRRRPRLSHRPALTQEVEELTQEVFLALFADGARVLRSWDVQRGLSLRNFVGLVAEREIADILQSGRRRPWNEQRTAEEPSEAQMGTVPGPEAKVAARELFANVSARLREELSPQGFKLFEMLLVDDCPVEDACAATGMSRDAIYAWRSRLPKIVRRIAEAITG